MIQWLQNYSGTGIHGENLEKNELENLRKELKHYRKKYEKELKDIEIISEDEEPLGQEEQKNIDEEMKRKRQKKKDKRPTISDEPLSNNELLMNNNNNFRQEQIGDPSEKFEKFKEKIQSLSFFKYLTQFELNQVLSSFKTETFNEGDTIFKQGTDADKLYFIEKGEISCWKTMRPEDPKTFIKTLKEGDSFGELALMYNYIRNYTIIAKTNVVLFSLDRRTYKNIVQGNIIKQREYYKNILEKVDILQTLTPEELSKIIDIDDYRLGALKMESTFVRGKYLRQKCYMEEWEDGTMNVTVAGLPKKLAHVVNFDNFKIGFTTANIPDEVIGEAGRKLTYKHVKGGVILAETDFTIQ